jgi:hypothetical protein
MILRRDVPLDQLPPHPTPLTRCLRGLVYLLNHQHHCHVHLTEVKPKIGSKFIRYVTLRTTAYH